MKKFFLRALSLFFGIYAVIGIPHLFKHFGAGRYFDALTLAALLVLFAFLAVRLWESSAKKRVITKAITHKKESQQKPQASQDENLDPLMVMVINDIENGTPIVNIAQKVAEVSGMDLEECEEKVQTFASCYHGKVDVSGYIAAGIKEYEFMASLDDRTCPVCGALDGQHFRIEDAKIGVNYPPMHLGCRCTTVMYDPDDETDWIASGQTMPKRTTFKENKQKYID